MVTMLVLNYKWEGAENWDFPEKYFLLQTSSLVTKIELLIKKWPHLSIRYLPAGKMKVVGIKSKYK